MTGRRVQVTWRHKGGRKPDNVVYVGRPSRWGNPFPVEAHGRRAAVNRYRLWAADRAGRDPRWLAPLAGKTLACYCPLDQECHADVLLELLQTPPGHRPA